MAPKWAPELVTVIVTTFNQAKSLKWLLRSLEEQTYSRQFEVLICDDGSGESVRRAIESAGRRGRLTLRHLWQAHRGNRVAQARNMGIQRAKGDLLLFLDGDCVARPDWIANHVKLHSLKKTRRIVAGTRVWSPFPKGPLQNLSHLRQSCRSQSSYPDRDQQLRLSRTSAPWTACWAFNFSVPRRPEVFFNPNQGWGSEEYELFCRLENHHNYESHLSKKIEVLHLELPKISKTWNPWVSGKHEHIADYVKNLLSLTERFPDLDLTEALWPLHHFVLDPQIQKWRRALPKERIHLEKARIIAENWANNEA